MLSILCLLTTHTSSLVEYSFAFPFFFFFFLVSCWISSYWVINVLYLPFKYMFCKYFLPFHSWPFPFLNGDSWRAKLLNLMKSNTPFLLLCTSSLSRSKKSCHPRWQMFPSRNFIVVAPTIKSMILLCDLRLLCLT